jgi:hypothetical protein
LTWIESQARGSTRATDEARAIPLFWLGHGQHENSLRKNWQLDGSAEEMHSGK